MGRPKVFVTRRWPPAVERELEARFEAVLNADDRPLDREALAAALADCDALCPTVTDAIDAALFDQAPLRARVIANFGVGINHIDLDAARRRRVVVTNTPDVLTDCTADLAMTLLLMTARRAGEGERLLREGQWTGWRPTQLLGTRVAGKTLGIIGFGRIGQAVARRARFGFDMRILYQTPGRPPRKLLDALGAERRSTPEAVLAESDFVSLHCPGGGANRHLIDAARLACMRPHAFLVNTARGDVVDTDALIMALRERRIAGAGLDVYEGEPDVPTRLRELDNVVLLPHLGSASVETREAMGRRVIANLEAFFAGREPGDRVA